MMFTCSYAITLMLSFDCIQNGLTAYDFASSRSHAAVCQLLEQYYGYEVANIVMIPLIIITTGFSHSRVIVILCQPLSSQLAGNMIPSQAYRHSGISWSMHGSELSDTPKHQESDTAPQKHSYDETAS